MTRSPTLFVAPIQVPDVSPEIVKVFFSQVFAELIAYVNGYDLFLAKFCNAPPNVPVKEDFAQKDRVIVDADALPKDKSEVLKPSICWEKLKCCNAVSEASAVVTKNFCEKLNPAGASVSCVNVTAPSVSSRTSHRSMAYASVGETKLVPRCDIAIFPLMMRLRKPVNPLVIADVLAVVTRPFASIARTGIDVVPP